GNDGVSSQTTWEYRTPGSSGLRTRRTSQCQLGPVETQFIASHPWPGWNRKVYNGCPFGGAYATFEIIWTVSCARRSCTHSSFSTCFHSAWPGGRGGGSVTERIPSSVLSSSRHP